MYGDGKAMDPVVAVAGALEGLGALNRWLATAGADGGGVDAGVLTVLAEGVGSIDAAVAAARVRLIDRAEDVGVAAAEGAVSTAAWLAQTMRLTSGHARREVRTAVVMAGLDGVLDALTAGQISRAHAQGLVAAAERHQADQEAAERARRAAEDEARREREEADRRAQAEAASLAEKARLAAAAAARERALAERAAREAAEREARAAAERAARRDELLGRATAGESPDQVRDAAKAARAADPDAMEASAAAQVQRRSHRDWIDDELQMGCYAGRMPLADYEMFKAAMQAARHPDHPDTPEAERRSHEQVEADAFADLIAAAVKAGDLGTVKGVKPHVTVTAPVDTLLGGDQAGRGQFGSWLSAETVRRLGCDAGLVRAIVDAAGQVLDIGRETRRWTTAQYRAAEVTFGGCAFPIADGAACGRPIGWTDLHHIIWWRHGGRTDQANGVPLCRRHHTAIHHDGWTLTYDFDTVTVTIERTRHGRHIRRTVCFTPQQTPSTDPMTAVPPDRTGRDGRRPPDRPDRSDRQTARPAARARPHPEPTRLPL
ncbi:DUF222 domain-containing protein [Euzebya sp.]|uniref:HNH endonuclease n=1 Tax=Euzebya sp. TaxID=1971409 RepID=UPI003517AF62